MYYIFNISLIDFGAYGHQYVNVYLNEDVTFTSRVFIKDRDHIILDEISKMDSPLNYLQNILKKIKYNEGALALPTIETKILEGTKHLLKTLNKIPDDGELIVHNFFFFILSKVMKFMYN